MNKENESISQPRKSYFQLIALGEPFRLMFPLGTFLGIFGVLMWPLFVWNITKAYPGVAHPRIMIEGFLTAFVIGFLGTALPRLLDVPRVTLAETLSFGSSLILITGLHFTGKLFGGDLLFFFTLLGFVVALVARAFFRKDTPPPAFVLVAMGILSALIGCTIQLVMELSPEALPPQVGTIGRLLLNQGFLLLPIMGVGAFLLPRFFSLPNRQSFPESIALPPGWIQRAGFALLCGLMVVASFAFEATGSPRIGYGLRTAAVLVYLYREVPVHQAGLGGGSLALGLRLALFSIPSGFFLLTIWPERLFSFLHVVFIAGFSLLTFIVATRVILGHSGQSSLFRASLWPVLILAACLALAMLTRVSADWMPIRRMSHYAYAAVAWITGVLIWAGFILPSVGRGDAEG